MIFLDSRQELWGNFVPLYLFTEKVVLFCQLLGGLNDKILAGICAQGFETVLEETPDLLNRSTHANITLMHKQRFFLLTLPSLLDGFGSAASGRISS